MTINNVWTLTWCLLLGVCATLGGCATPRSQQQFAASPRPIIERLPALPGAVRDDVQLATFQQEEAPEPGGLPEVPAELPAANQPAEPLRPPSPEVIITPEPDSLPAPQKIAVNDVAASIHSTYPLLEAAYQDTEIAAGNQLAASGAFDTKLKAGTENKVLGFYNNYRHRVGFDQPIYHGGDVFAGYRVGRGLFEPWYLERETNKGGEYKAGIRLPLLKDRSIDTRRADLWRADIDRERVDPEIYAQLVLFVRDGTVAYWDWIAAGKQVEIGREMLELAVERNQQIARKVDLGDAAPPLLKENQQTVAKREAKLIDLERKLQQTALKLSLYYRSVDGMPLVPSPGQLADFPPPVRIVESQLDLDTVAALVERPELAVLDAIRERLLVDYDEAQNETLPDIDALLVGSQDTGEPTSSKRDKSPFELEAGIFVEVPLQRRKAHGKMQATNGKLNQVAAKRRFVEDKIRTEMRVAFAAVTAAYRRVEKTRELRELANYMADVERRKFELGDSNLLSVVLREQYAIEAAIDVIGAMFELRIAIADYDAAMARSWPRD